MNKWLIGILITGTLVVPLLFSWNALEIIKLKTFDALIQRKSHQAIFYSQYN